MQGAMYYYRRRHGGAIQQGSGSGTGGSQDEPTLPTVAAIHSDKIADSLGANLHIPFSGWAYQVTPDVSSGYSTAAQAIKASMDYIKARHVRDNISVNSVAQRTALHTICADGIDVLFSCGDLASGALSTMASPTAIVADMQSHYNDIHVILGGLNESNANANGAQKSATWAQDTRTYQQNLWNAAHPAGFTVNSPPLADGSTAESQLGSVNAWCDNCELHIYQGAGQPSTNMAGKFTASPTIVSASKPRWITELGYHTAIHDSVGYPPVPLDVQAVYTPILLVEAFRQGSARSYIYELVNDRRNDALDNWQRNFGLFNFGAHTGPDWTPKPAATSLRNLMLLISDPGDAYSPASVPMTVTGGDATLRFVLTGKSDGTYALIMYRDKKVYNAVANKVDAGSYATVTPQNITVTFDVSRTVKQYQPDSSPSAASTTANTVHTVSLAGSMKVLTF